MLRRLCAYIPHSGNGWGATTTCEPLLMRSTNDSFDLVESADQLLFDRLRLGLKLILAGVAVVFVGEILMHGETRPLVNVWQGINFLVVLAALRSLRSASERSRNFALGIGAYAVTIVATGAVGIAAGDAMTPVVLVVGLAVVTSTLIPWSPWWQLLSILMVSATAIWLVATVVKSPRLFWLQNVGALAPTLAATVVISATLNRQRAAVARAERDRLSREVSLREANQRLGAEIQEHRRTEDALRFAMRELDHRVKNTLAVVQSVTEHTLRSSSSMGEFRAAFDGRIHALARIHTALADRRWKGLPVSELIALVVGPYRRHADSITIDADGTFISGELVRVLGMALHELATNAAKHGALSTDVGRVAISSRVTADPGERLYIEWSEDGGPPVIEPARRGFGMQLIEDALAYEVDGSVTLQFPDRGVRCEIRIPVPEAAI